MFSEQAVKKGGSVKDQLENLAGLHSCSVGDEQPCRGCCQRPG